jgi:hypothetical protein
MTEGLLHKIRNNWCQSIKIIGLLQETESITIKYGFHPTCHICSDTQQQHAKNIYWVSRCNVFDLIFDITYYKHLASYLRLLL